MNQNKQSEPAKLLEVRDLEVSFYTPAGEVKAVGGISYDLKEHVRNVKLSMMSTGESRRQYLNDEAVLEFSTYSQKVRAGEIELADKKTDDDEPMVNP